MANDLQVTKLNILDVLNSTNQGQVLNSGGVLYLDGVPFAPPNSGNLNANELMMINVNLTSGATTQKIYYPVGYNTPQNPWVVYEVYHANPSHNEIIANQLGEVTTDYFSVRFTQPISDDQHHLQALIFKNDNFITLESSGYDLNPLRVKDSLFVDQRFGWDAGTFSGLRQNPNRPFRTLQAAYSKAQTGDHIFVWPGNYSGIEVDKGNLSFSFFEGATITESGFYVKNSNKTTFSNLNVNTGEFTSNLVYGVKLDSTAEVVLKGNNKINLSGTSDLAIQGDGKVVLDGDLVYNKRAEGFIDYARDSEKTGIFVSNFARNNGTGGANGSYTFNDITKAIAFANPNSKITVLKGSYEGFTNAKAGITFEFDKDSWVTGQVVFNGVSGTVDNLNIDSPIHIQSNGHIDFKGQNQSITQDLYSISGDGTVRFLGDFYYRKPIEISGTIVFDKTKNLGDYGHQYGIYVEPGNEEIRGHNGTIRFNTLQEAVNYITGDETIFVKKGNYTGVDIYNKPRVEIRFADQAKVTRPITVSGTSQDLVLTNFVYDAGTYIDDAFGIRLEDGVTGSLRGDSRIRVPFYFSRFFITGNEPNTGQLLLNSGFSLLNYSGTFFENPLVPFDGATVTGAGISGWYARQAGSGRGNFYINMPYSPATGRYSTISGTFTGGAWNVVDTIGFWKSGTATGDISGLFLQQVSGATASSDITGYYYSGVDTFFVGAVNNQGDYPVIGYYTTDGFVNTTTFKDNLPVIPDASGYFMSGRNATFDNPTDSYTGRTNESGFLYSGLSLIPNTYFELGVDIPKVTGYYFSGGLSGFYISGTNGGVVTGVRSSGLLFNTRVSISGNGAIDFGNAIYNQLPWTGITNLLGNTDGFNSGAGYFSPLGVVF